MQVKEKLKLLLMQQCGEFLSGAAIAKELEVSRNAVWKAIQELKSEGVPIQSHPRKGYQLSADGDVISEEILKHLCHAESLGKPWVVLDSVDSTNTYCKTLASQGAAHGTIVTAHQQTGGRGRLGRTFHSPKDSGLYLSILLRPDYPLDMIQLITACTAVAVAETVDRLTGANTKIKWVNDLFLNGRKYAGILTEGILSCESGRLDALIIGIGINIKNTRTSLPSEVASIATSIAEETGVALSRAVLAAALVERLETALGQLSEKSFLAAYRERSLLIGQQVTVFSGNETYPATVTGIDDMAGLCLTLPDGSEKTLYSGEVSVRLT